jgi:hypothetical protein
LCRERLANRAPQDAGRGWITKIRSLGKDEPPPNALGPVELRHKKDGDSVEQRPDRETGVIAVQLRRREAGQKELSPPQLVLV